MGRQADDAIKPAVDSRYDVRTGLTPAHNGVIAAYSV